LPLYIINLLEMDEAAAAQAAAAAVCCMSPSERPAFCTKNFILGFKKAVLKKTWNSASLRTETLNNGKEVRL
jgi:hypothetical protein